MPPATASSPAFSPYFIPQLFEARLGLCARSAHFGVFAGAERRQHKLHTFGGGLHETRDATMGEQDQGRGKCTTSALGARRTSASISASKSSVFSGVTLSRGVDATLSSACV